jgi:hypothetical protein
MVRGRLTIELLTFERMLFTSPNSSLKLSPFQAILQDGIDRLLEFLPEEEFTFIVKGETLKLTISEAVFISPIISESLKSDPSKKEFDFLSDEIETKDFSSLINLIHSREEIEISRTDEMKFLLICKLLGNERLSLLILELFHFDISSSISLKSNPSNRSNPSNESKTKSKSSKVNKFYDLNVENCASQFNLYSVDELRNVSKQILHELL